MKAGERARTVDIQLGKLTLYQLSYTRGCRSFDLVLLLTVQNTGFVPLVPPWSRQWPMPMTFHRVFGRPDAAARLPGLRLVTHGKADGVPRLLVTETSP